MPFAVHVAVGVVVAVSRPYEDPVMVTLKAGAGVGVGVAVAVGVMGVAAAVGLDVDGGFVREPLTNAGATFSWVRKIADGPQLISIATATNSVLGRRQPHPEHPLPILVVFDSPVPGSPVLRLVPRRPMLTRAPRGPALIDRPRRERFRLTPGARRMRLRYRHPGI